jgi:hypothetical protein
MERDFLEYTEALKLKELGFDEPCFGYYEPNKKFKYINWETFKDFPYLAKNSEWQDLCGAATFSQAFRWFREKHGWISNVWTICISTDGITSFEYAIDTLNDLGVSQYRENFPYKTYEEAELDCLKELIEIVKEKQL